MQQFERDFAFVIADEDYRQTESLDSDKVVDPDDLLRPYRMQRAVDLGAEMLFLWLEQDRSWMSVRSPLKVGGESIADSKDRLERVLRNPTHGFGDSNDRFQSSVVTA